MVRRWTLIANPIAGRGGAVRVADGAAQRLRAAGHLVDVALTTGRGDAATRSAAAVAAGVDVVVVCGGDGTVAEVLPALAGTRTALGLLPFGTGNDLARALGIPRNPRHAVSRLLASRPAPLDLGRCGDRWFATVAAFGFDAEVNRIVAQGGAPLSGTAGYLWATLRHLRTYRPPRVRISGDFGDLEMELFLAAVANTRSYGGGLRVAPDADPEDGRFDVCLVDGSLTPAQALSLLPRLFWGGHVRAPSVRILRSAWVRLEPLDGPRILYADGELLTETPTTLRVEAAALRVLRGGAAAIAAPTSGLAPLSA